MLKYGYNIVCYGSFADSSKVKRCLREHFPKYLKKLSVREGKYFVTANSSRTTFKILVDADSCPVKDIIVEEALKNATRIIMVASISHRIVYQDPEISVITVDNVPQAADIAVLNNVVPGDIVVTGDYGLASVVLSKSATPLSPRGFVYTTDNIDRLLLQRHIDAKIRRSGGRTKGPKALNAEDRKHFRESLRRLLFLT